jgi:hypothetical protein
MSKARLSTRLNKVTCLALGLSALACSGCLIIAAGATGGAALGYFYYKGELCNNYYAALPDTMAATRGALAELNMPVLKEEAHKGHGTIQTSTPQNDKVTISFRPGPTKVPAEAATTLVGVRVGIFGDDPLSENILGHIQAYLLVPGPPPGLGPIRPIATPGLQPQTAPPPLIPGSVQPVSASETHAQTAPPPLAGNPIQPVSASNPPQSTPPPLPREPLPVK